MTIAVEQPIVPASSSTNDQASGISGEAIYYIIAALTVFAFCFTLNNASSLVFELAIGSFIISAVIALVVVPIWGRSAAQSAFPIVVAICFGILIYLRTSDKPKLGITYVTYVSGALVTWIKPDGPLGRAGFRGNIMIQKIDGIELGTGKVDLADLINSKHVFDRVTITAYAEDTLPTNFDVTLSD